MSAKYTFLAWDTPIENAPLKLALLQLANNADDNGFSYYSISKMALSCGMSEKTFQRKIKEMEKMGILKVERRANRSSLYNLIGDEMGVTLCPLQNSGETESLGGATESPLLGDRESLDPNSTPIKESNNIDLLNKITCHWNEIMTSQPKINLLSKDDINVSRKKAIAKIIKNNKKWVDHEYWQGYFYRLSTLKHFEWHRENVQVKFDQATNYKKFTDNIELMRMEESA